MATKKVVKKAAPKKAEPSRTVLQKPAEKLEQPAPKQEPTPPVVDTKGKVHTLGTGLAADKQVEVGIADARGVIWSLGLGKVPGGREVLKNGEVFPGGGTELAIANGKVYLRNDAGQWFESSETEPFWVATEGAPV